MPAGITPLTVKDVQILFVMPGTNVGGSVIEQISLDDQGDLIDNWPGGFFEEGYKERYGL